MQGFNLSSESVAHSLATPLGTKVHMYIGKKEGAAEYCALKVTLRDSEFNIIVY